VSMTRVYLTLGVILQVDMAELVVGLFPLTFFVKGEGPCYFLYVTAVLQRVDAIHAMKGACWYDQSKPLSRDRLSLSAEIPPSASAMNV